MSHEQPIGTELYRELLKQARTIASDALANGEIEADGFDRFVQSNLRWLIENLQTSHACRH